MLLEGRDVSRVDGVSGSGGLVKGEEWRKDTRRVIGVRIVVWTRRDILGRGM